MVIEVKQSKLVIPALNCIQHKFQQESRIYQFIPALFSLKGTESMGKNMALSTLLLIISVAVNSSSAPLQSTSGIPGNALTAGHSAKSIIFLNEGFEYWPPEGWTINPPSGYLAWAQGKLDCSTYGPWVSEPDSGAEHTISFAAYSMLYPGSCGDLETPAITLPNPASSCSLGFYVYNRPDTSHGNNDSLIVSVTSDSGMSWSKLGEARGDINDWTYYAFSLSAYAGQTIRIQFSGYSDINGSDICLDEVWFGQRPANDAAITALYAPARQQLSPIPPSVAVKNYGTDTVDSLTVTCRIDSADVPIYQNHSDVTALGPGETRKVELPLWTPAAANGYSAALYLSCLADANPANDTVIVPTNAYIAPRTVLAMDFTATWCFDCPYMQNALHQLKQEASDSLCVMGIHIWGGADIFCNQHSTDILNYYNNVDWIPTVIWDGGDKQVGGFAGDYDDCRREFNKRKGFNAPFTMDLAGTVSGDTVRVDASMNYLGGAPLPAFAKLAAVEDRAYVWPSLSAPVHCDSLLYILRDVVPTSAGDSLMISQGVTEISFDLPLDPTWAPAKMNFIVYAENRTTKEVCQAGQISYAELSGVAGDPGRKSMDDRPVLQQTWPNPAHSNVKISYDLNIGRHVVLAIFDITGRKVCDLVSGDKPAGRHETTWNGCNNSGHKAACGIYFSILKTTSGSTVRKITLIK